VDNPFPYARCMISCERGLSLSTTTGIGNGLASGVGGSAARTDTRSVPVVRVETARDAR